MLHVRKFSDSRVIVDFFTEDNGRVSGVLRLPKKNTAAVQAFRKLQIFWKGEKDLKTILSCEHDPLQTISLVHKQLYCGFYLNELIQRLLPLDDAFQDLFAAYEKSLVDLSRAITSVDIETVLRTFEFLMLKDLGFQVNLDECIATGGEISEFIFYRYKVGEGFIATRATQIAEGLVSGRDIIAIANLDFNQPSTLKAAKHITRYSLQSILGSRPLKSRELFM